MPGSYRVRLACASIPRMMIEIRICCHRRKACQARSPKDLGLATASQTEGLQPRGRDSPPDRPPREILVGLMWDRVLSLA